MTENRLADGAQPLPPPAPDQSRRLVSLGRRRPSSGPETEDRPIFLSVGYAACHWCHVMEHESFEDEATATLLNEAFVCVKVDREERPDIDALYMRAVQLMTRAWRMADDRHPHARAATPSSPAPTCRATTSRSSRAAWWSSGARSERTSVNQAAMVVGSCARPLRRAGPAALRGDGRRAPPHPRYGHGRVVRSRSSAATAERRSSRRTPSSSTSSIASSRATAPTRRNPGDASPAATDAGGDGGRWRPRPRGRRVPPLQHGRRLVPAALREDALRQRPARAGVRALLRR